MVNENDPLPDVALAGADCGEVRLRDFAGQKLVVYFYPKDDTTGCTREAQDFTALAAEFEAAGTWVIGISKDSPKSHGKFADKYALKVRLLSDESGAACEAFGVWTEKNMYGRKYMGIERATFLVDCDGVVKKVWRKVKVAGHAEAVLAAARELP